MTYKTANRTLKIGQYDKSGMNVGASEGLADIHVIKPKQNLFNDILYTYIVQADKQRP